MKIRILLVSVLFLLFNSLVKGQNTAPPLPQRTVSLTLDMPLNFGEFIIVNNLSTGYVTIESDGNQNYSNVFILNKAESPQAARLSFHLCPGRSITPTWPATFNMYSNIGGDPVTVDLTIVKIGNTFLTNGVPFFSNKGCSDTHYIYIGGKFNLLAARNYIGTYTGSFSFTINNE